MGKSFGCHRPGNALCGKPSCGGNAPGFSNDEYDLVCNLAAGSLPGQNTYEAYHAEAQRIFAEELPVIPLVLRLKYVASRADFCGYIGDNTANEMWNIEEFNFGEYCE